MDVSQKNTETFNEIITFRKGLLEKVKNAYANDEVKAKKISINQAEFNANKKEWLDKIIKLNFDHSVYIICLSESDGRDKDEISNLFTAKKEQEREINPKFALPSLNKVTNFPTNKCLYVGSTTSNALGKRLLEHLGYVCSMTSKPLKDGLTKKLREIGSTTTAVKIDLWLPRWALNIYYYTFSLDDTVDTFALSSVKESEREKGFRECTRYFEDCIADQLQPLLGKRGSSPRG